MDTFEHSISSLSRYEITDIKMILLTGILPIKRHTDTVDDSRPSYLLQLNIQIEVLCSSTRSTQRFSSFAHARQTKSSKSSKFDKRASETSSFSHFTITILMTIEHQEKKQNQQQKRECTIKEKNKESPLATNLVGWSCCCFVHSPTDNNSNKCRILSVLTNQVVAGALLLRLGLSVPKGCDICLSCYQLGNGRNNNNSIQPSLWRVDSPCFSL